MKLLFHLSLLAFICLSIKTFANGKSVGVGISDVGTLSSITTSVEELHGIPTELELYQKYPKPFNPITKNKYRVPKVSDVSLKIFDVLGNEISTPVSKIQPAGFIKLNSIQNHFQVESISTELA